VGFTAAGCVYSSNLDAVATLFDGKSLRGWRRAGRGLWTIEEGCLVGRSDHSRPGPGYLFSEELFQDFDLRLEFWISRGGNSGIYVREPLRQWGTSGDDRPAHGESAGYEVQVDYNDPKNPTGSIYNQQSSLTPAGAEERWNRMRIECQGRTIRVSIDERLVTVFNAARQQRGVIGFQIHGQEPHDHVVKYRSILIRPLDR
jgi:hypothetical protein